MNYIKNKVNRVTVYSPLGMLVRCSGFLSCFSSGMGVLTYHANRRKRWRWSWCVGEYSLESGDSTDLSSLNLPRKWWRLTITIELALKVSRETEYM